MSFYRQQLEDWLKTQYVKADTVYDIGGEQGNVKDRVASWKVKNYKVLDLPHWNIEQEIGHGHNASADIIFCLEVFEYLINPTQAIENICALLKNGGKAYITFAFAYPVHEEIELDSLRYTEPGVKRLMDSVNLNITKTWYRIDKSGLLQQFYAADGMHPSKRYNHHNVTGYIIEVTK